MGESIKGRVYKELFNDIISGTFNDLDVINEKNLVEKYGASKTTVREVLVMLCSEGILRNIPRYGYQIVHCSEREITNVDIFRKILECSCMEQYWLKLTPENVADLRNYFDKLYREDDVFDFSTYWKLNMEFHLRLMSYYGNEYMYKVLKEAMIYEHRVYAQFYLQSWQKKNRKAYPHLHEKLVIALEQQDKYKAIQLLKDDISGQDDMMKYDDYITNKFN